MRALARVAPAIAAGLTLVLGPPGTSPAWALCPNCLAQQSTLSPTLKLIGLFLLIPFALAAGVFWIVRRLSAGQRRQVLLADRPAYRLGAASPPPSAPPSPASSAGGVQGG